MPIQRLKSPPKSHAPEQGGLGGAEIERPAPEQEQRY